MLHEQARDGIRLLAGQMVQWAQSGHLGAALGCSDLATVLWRSHLRIDPKHPLWVNRDRFILSNGHASALLYALLYCRGFELSWEELKAFRQWNSLTPGHPEYHPGWVEATTGPLGQGLGMGVGMALGLERLAMQWGEDMFDARVYVMVGDGCLMEGISHEVATQAASWNLDRLVVLWDDNGVTIDGAVHQVSKEDTCQRFRAYGWEVIGPIDGHDPKIIDQALHAAKIRNGRPKLIACRTLIGKGLEGHEGQASIHGGPIPESTWQAYQKTLSVDLETLQSDAYRNTWGARQDDYALWQTKHQHDPRFWQIEHDPTGSQSVRLPLRPESGDMATRKASQVWLQKACAINACLFGGSADLDASVLTHPGASSIAPYVHYGVREFGMFAVANGLALIGYRPYVGTFLVFSDYGKNAMRLAAMMQLPVTYVLTHDSIALGEDGPTHQPIEQLVGLRAIPGLEVWRPCDAEETFACWEHILQDGKGPSALILSRQTLPQLSPPGIQLEHGFYILKSAKNPSLRIISTGSEVALAMEIAERTPFEVEVISCPNLNRMLQHRQLWESNTPSLIIEAASGWSWGDVQPKASWRWTLDRFGGSAPGAVLQKALGFECEAVLKHLQTLGYTL